MTHRTNQLRRQLEAAQAKLQKAPDRGTELQIEKLQGLIEAAERDDDLRTERREKLAKEEQAKVDARQAAEQATIEADLRAQYNRVLPKPVTDDEWELVRESVLHRYRLQQMDRTDQLVKQTAARYRL